MLQDEDQDRSDVNMSVSVSNYLDTQRFGLLDREENKCTQLIGQFAEWIMFGHKSIACGGAAEGSILTETSDSDVMGTLKGFEVSEDNSSSCSKDQLHNISIVRSEQFPGYCKLQLSYTYYEMLRKRSDVLNDKCVVKQQDRLLISSKKFNENIPVPGVIPRESLKKPNVIVNGPAKRNGDVDYVQSFEINTWPLEAKKWKSRPREYNWPGRELLDRLEEEVSCCVVPVGNKSSDEFDLQWRLSFVEIERELIWNMNDTQFKCYICLKKLKNICMKESCAAFEKISTYQIKNIMFWLCERIPECEWKAKYLVRYVRLGLRKLQNCVWLSYNAHYIVPENNLWQNVGLSTTEKRNTVQYLESLIASSDETIAAFIIPYLKLNNSIKPHEILTYLLKITQISPKAFAYSRRCHILFHYSDCINTYFKTLMENRYVQRIRSFSETDILFLISIFQNIKSTIRIEHEAQIKKLYVQVKEKFPETDILCPCMAISKGKFMWGILQLIKSTCRTFGIDEGRITGYSIRDVVDQMTAGYEIDYLTASLNIAMVYFVDGQYSKVWEELTRRLLSKSPKIYITYNQIPFYLCLSSGKVTDFRNKWENEFDIRKERQNVVLDFEVEKLERDFLPFPLKLQKYLFGDSTLCVYVHPLVLARYILVLSAHYGERKSDVELAKELFVSAVSNSKFHKYYYFNLYLLGHIYYVMGDMKEAYNYFVQSATNEPSLLNAALYHIAIMIIKDKN